MQEHTFKQFDAELEAVRSQVLKMGGLVEEQIINAIDALSNGNTELATMVIENDHRVNALEVQIDETCSNIIARRQPTAGDLRMVMAIVKTITDLERIGDEAEKVARMCKLVYATDRLSTPRFTDLKPMGLLAVGMLRKALDAFARIEVKPAIDVAHEDIMVDEEFRSVLRQLITFMMEDPRTISISIEILFAAKALERIGDHAKNMAEYVIYMVKGKNVRHTSVEDLAREALE